MKVWVSRIVPYENVATEMMHFHVAFAMDEERYHRSCEVVVFIPKDDPRPLPELREEAVGKAWDFLAELTALRDIRPEAQPGEPVPELRRH